MCFVYYMTNFHFCLTLMSLAMLLADRESHVQYCRTCRICYMKCLQIGGPWHICDMQFSHFENLHIQGIMPVCYGWRLLEWLESCDGLKFSQLKVYLFIQDKNQSLYYFELCSPRVWITHSVLSIKGDL